LVQISRNLQKSFNIFLKCGNQTHYYNSPYTLRSMIRITSMEMDEVCTDVPMLIRPRVVFHSAEK